MYGTFPGSRTTIAPLACIREQPKVNAPPPEVRAPQFGARRTKDRGPLPALSRNLEFRPQPRVSKPPANTATDGTPLGRAPQQPGTRPTASTQNRRVCRAGGSRGVAPRTSTADHREAGQRPANSMIRLVGEEGFEPSRPFGHTDLNRARLPFRHPPWAGSKGSTTPSAPIPQIRSDASGEGRCHGGSSAALRATARRHGRGRLRASFQI